MRTPTTAGQFRHLRYDDDGADIYSCNWCDRTICIRDNPDQWNFCPHCGKSWFTRQRCRDQETPRWVWDRWKDEVPHTVNYHFWAEPAYRWVFEERTKWFHEKWGKWNFEYSMEIRLGTLGSWRDAKQHLEYCRMRVKSDRTDLDGEPIHEGILWEYRARIEKIT